MSAIVTVKRVHKTFRDPGKSSLPVLKDISFEILEGEFLVILGLSGAGKSTLLRIISGLEKEYQGEVIWKNEASPKEAGFVFQQFALLPWLNVGENIALGLAARGRTRNDTETKVREEEKLMGLEKFATAYPKELSGGMRQRVGVARALAVDPKIIFMDEPFSELDSFTAAELRRQILGNWQERKFTAVLVSHNISEALELADRVVVLGSRPGHIERIIQNTLPRPRDKRSADFYDLEDQIFALIRP